MVSGISGNSSTHAMWYMAVTGLEYCDHGGLPVAISMTVHPTDQTSAFRQPCERGAARMTSGAIQSGVPLAWPPVALAFSNWTASRVRFDAPKSASFTEPSLLTKTLAALTSRCAMPFEWRYSSPNKICREYLRRGGH